MLHMAETRPPITDDNSGADFKKPLGEGAKVICSLCTVKSHIEYMYGRNCLKIFRSNEHRIFHTWMYAIHGCIAINLMLYK